MAVSFSATFTLPFKLRTALLVVFLLAVVGHQLPGWLTFIGEMGRVAWYEHWGSTELVSQYT